jgi:hypothetical protein
LTAHIGHKASYTVFIAAFFPHIIPMFFASSLKFTMTNSIYFSGSLSVCHRKNKVPHQEGEGEHSERLLHDHCLWNGRLSARANISSLAR